jgi:hypothetical protein
VSEQLVPLSIRVPQSAADDIDRFAAARGVSKGELLRELVMEALAAKHASPPAEDPVSILAEEVRGTLATLTQLATRLEAWEPPQERTFDEAKLAELGVGVNERLKRSTTPAGGLVDADREFVRQLIERAYASNQGPAVSLPEELLAVPAQLEKLTEICAAFVDKNRHEIRDELRQLREQTAQMLAILHQYRTNGPPEAAAKFAGQLFQ